MLHSILNFMLMIPPIKYFCEYYLLFTFDFYIILFIFLNENFLKWIGCGVYCIFGFFCCTNERWIIQETTPSCLENSNGNGCSIFMFISFSFVSGIFLR